MHLVIHALLVFTLLVSTVRPGRPAILPFPWDPHSVLKLPKPVRTETHPVCIIGAGISGLNLGILLKAKGYNVEIFEEKNRVGGKVETYREGNSTVQIETGPSAHTSSDLALLEYINKFKLTRTPFNVKDKIAFDPDTGSIQNVPGPTGDAETQFGIALQRYREYHASYEKALEYGYLNATPDLFTLFSSWLAQRNLTILTPFFVSMITLTGYGHLDDIPALYALKLASPILPMSFATDSYYEVKEGLDTLMNRMAEGLNIKLKKKVVGIIRSHNGAQELHFEDGLPNRKCQRVILAFPPLLSKLKNVVTDLTSEEKDVLRQVKVQKYSTAGHHLPPLDHTIYYEGIIHRDPRQAPDMLPSPEGKCEVVRLNKQDNGVLKNTYTSYSWIRGDFDSGITNDELEKIGRETQRFVQKISPIPTTFFLRSTEYFPHVTTSSLREGFYENFDRIQGRNGLYYATTLLTSETLNGALLMTENFVRKYF